MGDTPEATGMGCVSIAGAYLWVMRTCEGFEDGH